jgi:hypothetical protein
MNFRLRVLSWSRSFNLGAHLYFTKLSSDYAFILWLIFQLGVSFGFTLNHRSPLTIKLNYIFFHFDEERVFVAKQYFGRCLLKLFLSER